MRLGFLLIVLCTSFNSHAKVIVSGYVRDASSGEALLGASVAILETGAGTITNTYGYYALNLDPGFYTVIFRYVGYETQTRPIQLNEDLSIDIDLQEFAQQLEEVTVTAEAGNANITRLETGSTQLPIQSIRKIPALLGEVDVIKAIQLLPGVRVTSEGSSGFSWITHNGASSLGTSE